MSYSTAIPSPMIIPIARFNANQWREYDRQRATACANSESIPTTVATLRNDIYHTCVEHARCAPIGDEFDGIPQSPVWGPVVIGEPVISDFDVIQYYRLVPKGLEGRYASTDGHSFSLLAPPPPLPPPFEQSVAPPLCPPAGVTAPLPAKIFRVTELEEVTLDQITEDLQRGRIAYYIRGSLVKPRLKVEVE